MKKVILLIFSFSFGTEFFIGLNVSTQLDFDLDMVNKGTMNYDSSFMFGWNYNMSQTFTLGWSFSQSNFSLKNTEYLLANNPFTSNHNIEFLSIYFIPTKIRLSEHSLFWIAIGMNRLLDGPSINKNSFIPLTEKCNDDFMYAFGLNFPLDFLFINLSEVGRSAKYSFCQ